MRLRSEVMLVMLSAAMPEIFAADVTNATASRALVQDSRGQPVFSSSGECWHSSMTAPPGAGFAPGCRGPAHASAAVAPAEGPAEQARTESAGAADQPTATAAGGSPPAAAASGPGSAVSRSGTSGYVTDSRGIVVRGSSGDCWRTGT